MGEHNAALSRRAFVGCMAAVAAATAFSADYAFATTSAEKRAEADAVRNQLVGLQADLEAASEKYHKALDEQQTAQTKMEEEQAKIDAANERIALIQDHLGTRARSMYRNGSASFIDFLLGSSSFEEFTQNWDLLNAMNDNDAAMVAETKQLREELEAAKAEYARQEQIAAEKAAEAKAIQDEVQKKVNEASQLLEKLDEEARILLEQEQAAAAAAAAAAAEEERRRQEALANQNNGGSGSSGGSSSGSGYGGPEVPSHGSVVDYALSRIGCPYEWGAEGPNSFDCSGLVRWSYLQVGISLPHYSGSLYDVAKQRVPVSEARPGDVLWRSGHVGIAVGYGGVPYVHAPTFGAKVRDTDSLSWSKFTHALRF